MPRDNAKEFKEYCLQFYRDLNHPYSSQRKVSINISDLETAVDILDSVLSIESKEKSFRGLKDQFYSAFINYLRFPRNEIGSLCNSVDKLSALIDPFLKKVAFYFLPKNKITTKSGVSVLIWKTSKYINILEAFKVIKASEIQKKSPSYWEGKPADLAILREGFTARQKGVHESRIHTLEELEKIVYSIIGTYIIVCLNISKNPSIYKELGQIIEKRRAVYLFEERVRSFHITNTLFSKKEHLLVYKHRNDIAPDIEGKKFLFVNYLAGRGPCFYWLKRNDKEIMTAWARGFLKDSTDEVIRANAVRFLIENAASLIKLQTLLETFPYYEDKEELSQYIRQFAKPSDRGALLKLCTDKREEVALALQELLAKMFPKIDETLKKLATSKSTAKRKLLRLIIREFAQKDEVNQYRNFINIRDKAQQIIYIYSLGEVGTDKDLKLLSNWVTAKRRNEIARSACWYAISKIANHLVDSKYVWSLVNKKNRIAKIAALEAITRDGIGPNFKSLFSKGLVNRFYISNIILEIATSGDNEIIRPYLTKATLYYNTRDLVLALCKVGDPKDFKFLFNLFSKYKGKIEFQNHVRVADAMAKICTKKQSSALKKFINSKEFSSYILPEQRRAKKRLPVENIDNQAFMRRVLAACFIEKANRTDISNIKKLLRHYYKWIAYKAATKLAQIGKVKDLDNLTQTLWNLDEQNLNYSDPSLYALCLLDKRLYKLD